MNPPYYALNKTRESFLGLNIGCANTHWQRLRGLLGKFRLNSGEGLWLVPSQGIHTIGLMFPVDLIYLNESDTVVQLVEHLRPFSISHICLKSTSVLALPTHSIYTSQTELGDRMLICRAQEMESYLTGASPGDRRSESSKDRKGEPGKHRREEEVQTVYVASDLHAMQQVHNGPPQLRDVR